MNLVVNFDQNQNSLPAGFVNDVEYVVNYFDSLFTANVTVTINVGYGEVDGQSIGPQFLGESLQAIVTPVNYSAVRNALIAQNAPGSSTLPASPPAGNPGILYMPTSEQKALGLISSDNSIDGYVGFSSDPGIFSYGNSTTPSVNQYYFIGVVEHEITEIMGRTSYLNYAAAYSAMDLFRYAEPGARQFGTGAPSYFSTDGGATNLNDWNNFQTGNSGDLGDWAPSAGDDAFNDNSDPGRIAAISPTDITLMNAIGWASSPGATLQYVGVGVFHGNNTASTVWQINSGIELWSEDNSSLIQTQVPNAQMGSNWNAFGVAPFNGSNGVLWTNGTGGQVAIWLMSGSNLTGFGIPNGQMGSNWSVVSTGVFTGNGAADILWHDNTNQVAVWTINGTTLGGFGAVNAAIGPGWNVVAEGDFFAVGRDALLWENTDGQLQDWLLSGTNLAGLQTVGQMGPGWQVAGVGNFKGITGGSQTSNIVWVNSKTNDVQIWRMQGGQITQFVTPDGHDGTNWQLVGVGDYSGSGYSELLWTNGSTEAQLWQIDGTQVSVTTLSGGGGNTTGRFGGGTEPTPAPALQQQSNGNGFAQFVGAGNPSKSNPVSSASQTWDTVIGSGDTDLVPNGEAISNPLIDGGTLELTSGAVVDGPITFADHGSGGTLFDADQASRPDTVIGFSEGSDFLTFFAADATSEAQVIASAQTVNGSTILTFSDQTSIVLAGITRVDTGIFA